MVRFANEKNFEIVIDPFIETGYLLLPIILTRLFPGTKSRVNQGVSVLKSDAFTSVSKRM